MLKMQYGRLFFWLVSLLLSLVSETHAYSDSQMEWDLKSYDAATYICILLIVLYATIVRIVIKRFNIPIPGTIFTLTYGLLGAIIIRFEERAKPYFYPQFDRMTMALLYLTLVGFKICFFTDIYVFFKCLPQILAVACPRYLVSSALVAFIMRLVSANTWNVRDCIIFGCIGSLTSITEVVVWLKTYGSKTRHLVALLEGEAIFGIATFGLLYLALLNYEEDRLAYWYQYLFSTLRCAGFACLLGLAFGLFGRVLMRRSANDEKIVLLVTLSIPVVAAILAYNKVGASINICVVVLGLTMGKERISLSADVDEFLVVMWEATFFAFDSVMLVRISIFTLLEVKEYIYLQQFIFAFVVYLIENLCRICTFFVLMPLLSRLGYGLTISEMLIWVWAGVKSPWAVSLTSAMLSNSKYDSYRKLVPVGYFLLYISTLLNGSTVRSLVDLLGIAESSPAKLLNFSHCLIFMGHKRDKYISILKMDRLMTDINWQVLSEVTSIQHLYVTPKEEEQDDEGFHVGYRYTHCSDCRIDVLNEPTGKELKEIKREARMRILKAKKISYAHQYQNGTLSKEGLKVLTQAVEMGMETEDGVIPLDELFHLFQRENKMALKLGRHLDKLWSFDKDPIKSAKIPRKPRRQIAYEIVQSNYFIIAVYTVLSANIVVNALNVTYPRTLVSLFAFSASVFQVLYLAECVLKINAFSWIYVFQHGIKTYFSSYWNILEFGLMSFGFLDLMFNYIYVASGELEEVYEFLVYSRFVRAIRFLTLLRYCSFLYPNIARYIDTKANYHVAVAYELGKAYVVADEEILEMLPQIIDDVKILEEIRLKLENDRLVLTKLLGIVQKDKPWIAITVKTAQAIRTVLNSMKHCVRELKTSGWIDESEFEKLRECLREKYKFVTFSLKFVKPCAPEVLFRQVSWMGDDEVTLEFLYEQSLIKKFSPGQVVCQEGHTCRGVYILVSGLLLLTYEPKDEVLNRLEKFGLLPIVDYISPASFNKCFSDFIVSGNCVGELSTLTGRPYDCKIVAETHCQLFLIRREIMKEAMTMSRGQINGLESRIWRSLSVRIAIPTILSVPSLSAKSMDEIRFSLERAVVPDLTPFRFLEDKDSLMQDILLIEGVVADFNTRQKFVAPCYIPQSVNKLILVKSGMLDVPEVFETKIMLIPRKDVTKFEVKISENLTFKITPATYSARCLHHEVRKKSSVSTTKNMLFETKIRSSRRRPSQMTPESSIATYEDIELDYFNLRRSGSSIAQTTAKGSQQFVRK